MENPITHLIRYTRPTPMDRVPYGTRWTFQDDDEREENYMQVSEEQSKPDWIRVGVLLEETLKPYFVDHDFLVQIAQMYKKKLHLSPKEIHRWCKISK